MSDLKLATIIGTRSEIVRLSECIRAFDKYFNHVLIHTGQNWDYGLNQILFQDFGIREPDYYLAAGEGNVGTRIGTIIDKSYQVLMKERPDALLILGDTHSTLSAISAKQLKIPIFHMAAGNRCFDENAPEEINRKIVDHISDVSMPYSEHARRNLLAEGISREFMFVTGSPMREVLDKNYMKIESSDVLKRLCLEKEKYFVVSAHRAENIQSQSNFLSIMSALNCIADKYEMPIVYSTHPNTWKHMEQRGFMFHPLVRQLNPFGFFDFNKLQKEAYCVISDSSTLSEEAAILSFPAVLMRTSTERPEVLDKGDIILGGISDKDICQSVDLCRNLWETGRRPDSVPDFDDDDVSVKVVKIIQSYTKIINKKIWGK